MITTKPQAKTNAEPKEVRAPGSAIPTVVEPGVTYAYNILLDKVGSTAVAQFHLPLSMSGEDMLAYTRKALKAIEMTQLKFDCDKLRVEFKLSSAMIDSQKRELVEARKQREEEARRSGSGKVAKPVAQQLLSIDNSIRQAEARHIAMQADLLDMEKRLDHGSDSSNVN